MIDDESPAGSWKQAIRWMKQMKNDAPVADRPNAEDYRNRAERAEAECQELSGKLRRLRTIAQNYRNRAERAEAECQELRAKLRRIRTILKEY